MRLLSSRWGLRHSTWNLSRRCFMGEYLETGMSSCSLMLMCVLTVLIFTSSLSSWPVSFQGKNGLCLRMCTWGGMSFKTSLMCTISRRLNCTSGFKNQMTRGLNSCIRRTVTCRTGKPSFKLTLRDPSDRPLRTSDSFWTPLEIKLI